MDNRRRRTTWRRKPEERDWKAMHIRIFTDGGRRRERSHMSGVGWVVIGQAGGNAERLVDAQYYIPAETDT